MSVGSRRVHKFELLWSEQQRMFLLPTFFGYGFGVTKSAIAQ
jgi:hypothetical protein